MNTESLQRLLALSDDELRQKILTIAAEAGVSRMQAGLVLRDMSKLRGLLENLTDADVAKYLSIIGKDKAATIAQKLNNGGL